jgi:nitrite reductase (NAD(P)H)
VWGKLIRHLLGLILLSLLRRLTEYFEHRNVSTFYLFPLTLSLSLSLYLKIRFDPVFFDPQVENLYLNPPSWYAEQLPDRFRYHLSETVISVSPQDHLVYTSKGRSFKYDKCVLATGSTASLPPYTSFEDIATTKGVFVYRNISDLDAIIEYAARDEVKHAVVVGGGLLGLEAAKAVYDLET